VILVENKKGDGRVKAKDHILQAENPEDVKGKCALCGKETNGMFFCFGCNHFICNECDALTNADDYPIGGHLLSLHQKVKLEF